MTAKKINVAIVGLGFGAEFIPLWQKHPHADCYAICQRNEEKLHAVGDYFGVNVRYQEFDALLKDKNVDVVHINSPIPDHGWMSIAALKGTTVNARDVTSFMAATTPTTGTSGKARRSARYGVSHFSSN